MNTNFSQDTDDSMAPGNFLTDELLCNKLWYFLKNILKSSLIWKFIPEGGVIPVDTFWRVRFVLGRRAGLLAVCVCCTNTKIYWLYIWHRKRKCDRGSLFYFFLLSIDRKLDGRCADVVRFVLFVGESKLNRRNTNSIVRWSCVVSVRENWILS